MVVLGIALIYAILAVFLLAPARKVMSILLAESVIPRPVLIFESDDWSPADYRNINALKGIENTLRRFEDDRGNPPVFTLGLIMRSPYRKDNAFDKIHYIYFSDPTCGALLECMNEGYSSGTFDLQLHGKKMVVDYLQMVDMLFYHQEHSVFYMQKKRMKEHMNVRQ